MEEKKKNDIADLLIENLQNCDAEQEASAELVSSASAINDKEKTKTQPQELEGADKILQKYKIKDIVFLAIITACTLVTGAIMPLLVNVPLFGIIQLGLGLQFSIFPVIGMMKVRKVGSLLFMSIFISCFLIFMFPPMALLMVCALIVEILVVLIFRGYKSDWACVLAGTLYMPMTVPFLYMYYNVFYSVSGDEKQAVSMFLGGANPGVVIGMTIAIVALCFVGAVVGMLIGRELRKAGVLKK
ncbi:MAG: MptD family putative ECF transporter S component, partial [Clostridia bacterium]|nr:MptD family putative ECF transporter S component [Clostridia bacterium]